MCWSVRAIGLEFIVIVLRVIGLRFKVRATVLPWRWGIGLFIGLGMKWVEREKVSLSVFIRGITLVVVFILCVVWYTPFIPLRKWNKGLEVIDYAPMLGKWSGFESFILLGKC